MPDGTPGPLGKREGRQADRTALDELVVPGGLGTRKDMSNKAPVAWIGRAAAKAEGVLSVCTGALLLAKGGLLNGLTATMHHGVISLDNL